jgi:hypothetical protein
MNQIDISAQNSIFLNIIIIFSPNYKNNNIVGTVKKSIPLMEQFIAFYKSIKKNLNNVKYDISIVHHNNFNDSDLNILKTIDVNLIKVDCNSIAELGIEKYNVNTRYPGTHRLMAETDMLLLKEPTFNWDVDFQKMYAGTSRKFPISIMKKMYNMFAIKNKYIQNYSHNSNLFISYNVKNIHKNNLYPHFNNGLTLLKEDFSKKVYTKLKENDWINKRNIYFEKQYHHHFGQLLSGFIKLELTDNWEPFNPGINYLLKVYDVNKFGKENISLLHYAGVGAEILVKKEFPEYF